MGTIHQLSGTEARFTVERYFKSGGPAEVRVTGRYDPNAFTSVDYTFQDGTRYLLFLRGSTDSLLKTSDCAGNRPVGGELRADELSLLAPGSAPDAVAAPSQRKELGDGATALLAIGLLGGVALLIIVQRARTRARQQAT